MSSPDAELSIVLHRRQQINDALQNGEEIKHCLRKAKVSVFSEFHEFSRKEIKDYQITFNRYDIGQDGYLDLSELKVMMEKLGAPQTHLSLKAMITEVDEDNDGKISFREFLLIYRKARSGELEASGLTELTELTEINVEEVGVHGAKHFFEAKIEQQLRSNKFQNEIREEQEERKKMEEDKIIRRQQFRQKAALFQQN